MHHANIHRFYDPLGGSFRRGRMQVFRRKLAVRTETRVLDVGGSQATWRSADVRPRATVLNLEADDSGAQVVTERKIG